MCLAVYAKDGGKSRPDVLAADVMWAEMIEVSGRLVHFDLACRAQAQLAHGLVYAFGATLPVSTAMYRSCRHRCLYN